MESYKLNALNDFFSKKGIKYHFASTNPTTYKLLTIKNIPIYARLANTPTLTEKGLMGVDRLAHNEGCLLCFSGESIVSLWMKNCKINLQAATIDKQGNIIDIINMNYKNPYYAHHSSLPATHVLEMAEDFFTKNHIKVGDKIRL